MVDYVETMPDADGGGDGDGVKSEFLDMGGLVEKKNSSSLFIVSHFTCMCRNNLKTVIFTFVGRNRNGKRLLEFSVQFCEVK